jgi:hypothetical protein
VPDLGFGRIFSTSIQSPYSFSSTKDKSLCSILILALALGCGRVAASEMQAPIISSPRIWGGVGARQCEVTLRPSPERASSSAEMARHCRLTHAQPTSVRASSCIEQRELSLAGCMEAAWWH